MSMYKQTRGPGRETINVPVHPRHRPLRVLAMGGGTGLANLLKGLKQYVRGTDGISSLKPLITDLSAVVTVTDDGGSSGRLRNEFNMLAPGDIRQLHRRAVRGRNPAFAAFPAPFPLGIPI